MDFEEFEKSFFYELGNNSEACFSIIERNKELIQRYLINYEKPIYRDIFINKLNDLIIRNSKEFKLIEDLLKHPLFSDVLYHFKKSDVLIRACKAENSNAINWLFTMDIDFSVQDDDGMTALMYAVKHPNLYFAVERLALFNHKLNNLSDKCGKTALFHAAQNPEAFKKLVRRKFDINHCDHHGDSLILYCFKHGYMEAVHELRFQSDLDLNYFDREGKNIIFYLFESNHIVCLNQLLEKFQFKGRIDINYRSKNGDTMLSYFYKKYYNNFIENRIDSNCERYLNFLNRAGVNFNCPIDEEGNTPIMYHLMTNDLAGLYYSIDNFTTVDFSVKNRYGINASYLALIKLNVNDNQFQKGCPLVLSMKNIKDEVFRNKTFDYGFQDKYHNNLLIHSLVRDDEFSFFKILQHAFKDEKIMNSVNDKQENALIIAIKLGRTSYLCKLFLMNINVNQQDDQGNTALHYAIEMRDKYAINSLVYAHANLKIKNNEGVTPFDLALRLDNPDILSILKKPLPPSEMDKKLTGKDKKLFLFGRKKKKTTDEKVDDYITKYRANTYIDQYKYMLEDMDVMESERRYSKKPKFYEIVESNLWGYLFPQSLPSDI